MCISCPRNVDPQRGEGKATVDACGQRGKKSLFPCGRHKWMTPNKTKTLNFRTKTYDLKAKTFRSKDQNLKAFYKRLKCTRDQVHFLAINETGLAIYVGRAIA